MESQKGKENPQTREGERMFYIVDENDQYIDERETREAAEAYCARWNEILRFTEWEAPMAHVVEG